MVALSPAAQKIVRRTLKGVAYALGGVVSLLIVAILAIVLYARSEAGERRLLDALEPVVNKTLAPLGLNLSVESLRGPLPSRLALRGIRLRDAQGIWLSINEASLDIEWMALWGGTLRVNAITVDRPELSRLPVLPASPKPVQPEQAAPDFSAWLDLSAIWPSWLPKLSLERLSIDDLVLEQAVVGQRLVLTLDGAASASPSEAAASLKVWNSMPSASSAGNADLASLSVALTPEQKLNVSVAVDNLFLPALEPELGLIPGLSLHLEGSGPLATWKGAWQAELHDGGTGMTSPGESRLDDTPIMATLNGDVEWTLESPRLLLTVDARTGQAPQSLWELIGQKNGQASAQFRLTLNSDDTHQPAPSSRTVTGSGQDIPLNATLQSKVQLTDMSWGTPLLQALFGSTLDVQNQLALALTPEGQTDITLSQLRLQSANLNVAGDATTSLPMADAAAGPDTSVTSSWLSSLLTHGDITAKFSASLPDLSGFTPGISAQSPLTLDVALAGPVHSPYASASFHTASLLVAQQPSADKKEGLLIDELTGQLAIPRLALADLWPPLAPFLPARPDTAEALVTGTIEAHANRVNRVKLPLSTEANATPTTIGEVGDLVLTANLATGWDTASQLTFGINQFVAQGAGIQAEGSVGGRLPARLPAPVLVGPPRPRQDAKSPLLALQGDVTAHIADWKKLSALAGSTIEGTDVSARVKLESSDNHSQSLTAEWQAATLAIKPAASLKTDADTTNELFSIKEWQGQAKLTGLEALFAPAPESADAASAPGIDFGKLTLDASNKTGRIVVSDALLAATTATLSGPLNGPISLQLTIQDRREVRANQPPDPNRPKRTPRPASDEPPTLDQEIEKLTRRLARNITGKMEAVWRPGILEIAELRLGTSSRSHPMGVTLSAPASVRYGISSDMPQGGLSIKRMELAIDPAGNIVLEGTLNPQTWKFNASINDLDLSLFQGMLTAMPNGRVQAQASLRGNMQRPAGEMTIELENFQVPGSLMPPASVLITGKLENSARGSQLSAALTLPDKERQAFGVHEAVANLQLPLLIAANGLPMPAPNQPLKGEVIWRGALAPLWNFIPLADKRLFGEIALDAQLGGTLLSPRLTLNSTIRNAEYQDLSLGVLLKNIQATLDIQDAQIVASSSKTSATANTSAKVSANAPSGPQGLTNLHASADDGMGGTLSLDGSVDLAVMSLSAKAAMDNLKPLRRQDLRINLSGTASVVGNLNHPAVNANITVNEGELTLENLPGGNIRTLPISNGPATSPSPQVPEAAPSPEFGGMLQLKLQIPNRFFVRGHGLDSEWRGDFDISGPLLTPSLSGTLSAVRGNLDFLGKNFKLSRGLVSFAGGTQINPMLDVVMTYQTNAITADIGISGLATRPRLSLSSQPSLPQDEILAQIMFGQSADKLGRLEALQLASAVASLANLSSGSGFGILGTARKIFGVDVLRLNSGQGTASDNDDLGGAELEVGKYITDKVYVGVSQGISGDASTGVVVEIELTPRVNVEARAGTTRTEVGVEWKYDY